MDTSIVQHDDRFSWNVGQHVIQKANDIRTFRGLMLSLLQKLVGTRDRTDGQNLVSAGFPEDDGRLAAQRPGVLHRAFQAKSHLIQKNQSRAFVYFF
ncbi:hypothetical protein ACVWZX_004429 [Deinococcus sp. UYEF24]